MTNAFYSFPIRPEDILHYGVKRKSGRYPWGSGERPYQSYKRAIEGTGARSSYFTSERTIPKGTIMYRTTINKNESNDGSTSVTYLEPDRDLYRGGWIRQQANSFRFGIDGPDTYERKMTLTKDLRIPSRNTYKQVLKEVIDENPKLLKESVEASMNYMNPPGSSSRSLMIDSTRYRTVNQTFVETLKKKFYSDEKMWDGIVDRTYKRYKDMDIDEAYVRIALGLGYADNLKKVFFDKLSNKGYNAVVDEGSIGKEYANGIDPLIVFDSSALKNTSTRKISKDEELSAAKRRKEWQNETSKLFERYGKSWNK